ncbi:hypothetical protein LTR56_010745 [Elasticomyces elasticus]|nr:hypothetical protein LTR56_010745 [Elasticomyces elasticus]KAK3667769.1 hypothetical protein LTR22_001214 [Elasticomyces elasticus]KAK4932237.1 hypothetical protein LTR49_001534 [Elasticomyces elasticus]KAK5745592.1 hypothetical protein LTS12_023074 [Elasticomyces elasticus]
MPALMCEHRAFALELVLNEIDRNPGAFATAESQEELLSRLIKDHNLKDKPAQQGGRVVDMTVARLADIASRAASDKRQMRHQTSPKKAFWQDGRKMLDESFVRTVKDRARVISKARSHAKGGHLPTTRNASAKAKPAKEDAPTEGAAKRSASSSLTAVVDEGGDEITSEPGQKKLRLLLPPQVDAATVEHTSTGPVKGEVPRVAASEADTAPIANVDLKPAEPVTILSADVPSLAASLVKVSDQNIQSALNTCWVTIQNIAQDTFDGLARSEAVWSLEPDVNLRHVYERSLTRRFKARLEVVRTDRSVSAAQALELCLASCLFEFVLSKPLPWTGPKDLLPRTFLDAMSGVLSQTGCKWSADEVIWQTAKTMLDSSEEGSPFVELELKSIANDIATTIVLALGQQLTILGARGRCPASAVAPLVLKALILAGKLNAAPDYYRLEWIASGRLLDRATMEEHVMSEGRREVLWCLSPLVKVRKTEAVAWEDAAVAVPAKVYARALPAGTQ